MIKEITNYPGQINYDINRPDGSYRKLLNSSPIISLGWKPVISLKNGLIDTYKEFLKKN
jgi:GDP-L-fucose synthase